MVTKMTPVAEGADKESGAFICYKVLTTEHKSQFRDFPWPVPTDDQPGEFVVANGEIVLCKNGLHGWNTKERAIQEAQGKLVQGEVYEMHIYGTTVSDHEKTAGAVARLVKKVWPEPVQDWEEFYAGAKTALEVARRSEDLERKYRRTYPGGSSNPVAPSFHEGGLKFWPDSPERCGTCGLPEALHTGWEKRKALHEKLRSLSTYNLIVLIQALLDGKPFDDEPSEFVKAHHGANHFKSNRTSHTNIHCEECRRLGWV